MFDTYFSELHILDPAHSTERYKLHQQLHPILDDSLRKCLTSFYQGWSLEPLDQWKLKYPQLGPVFNRSTIFKFLDICRASLYRNDPFTVYVFFCTFSDDCGTIMLHYARNYNGMYLDEPLNEVCFASLWYCRPWMCFLITLKHLPVRFCLHVGKHCPRWPLSDAWDSIPGRQYCSAPSGCCGDLPVLMYGLSAVMTLWFPRRSFKFYFWGHLSAHRCFTYHR